MVHRANLINERVATFSILDNSPDALSGKNTETKTSASMQIVATAISTLVKNPVITVGANMAAAGTTSSKMLIDHFEGRGISGSDIASVTGNVVSVIGTLAILGASSATLVPVTMTVAVVGGAVFRRVRTTHFL